MNIAFIFPGQGSQYVGMGKDFYENFSESREVFEIVDNILNENLSDLIFNGNIDDLNKTINTQPALMAVSVAISRAIEKNSGQKKIYQIANIAAGHSLGQYSALCSIGAIELAENTLLLRKRALSMQDAMPIGEGAMAAILKPDYEVLLDILNEASNIGVCEIANDNSDMQVVISGKASAIDYAIDLLKKTSMRAVKLPVSAAFHSSLMNKATEKMRDVILNSNISECKIPIIDNVTIQKITEPELMKKSLINQISGKVRWRETMQILHDCDLICEIGAGKVLSSLFKKSYPEKEIFNISTIQEMEIFLNKINLE